MEIVEKIKEWANERGLYDKGDAMTQFCKLSEEFGELGKAVMNKDQAEFDDAIGDMFVVMTNLVELSNKYFDREGASIEHCINGAYDVIKSRKGKMINGTFVKDE